MKVTEAFNFMKLIIQQGKSNNLSVNKVRKSVNEFLDVLTAQNSLSKTGNKILYGVSLRIDDIMHDKVSADEVFVSLLSAMEKDKGDSKITFSDGENYVNYSRNKYDYSCGSVQKSCGVDEVSSCGRVQKSCSTEEVSDCGSRKSKNTRSSCGSSSSSCGRVQRSCGTEEVSDCGSRRLRNTRSGCGSSGGGSSC